MNNSIKKSINNMLQGLAYWMAYRREMSSINIIEADAVSTAIDILRSNLPSDYVVEREITKTSLPIVGSKKIDLGIRNKYNSYWCLIEFKLADATNAGYVGDIEKLYQIKKQNSNIDCLSVILYRKHCRFDYPSSFVDSKGKAKRTTIRVGQNNIPVKVRRVCNAFASATCDKSRKTICLEVIYHLSIYENIFITSTT